MIRYIGTDPRKSVLMPRAISLRSRVLGNWQARVCVQRGCDRLLSATSCRERQRPLLKSFNWFDEIAIRVQTLGFLLNAIPHEVVPIPIKVGAAHVQHRLRTLDRPTHPRALHPVFDKMATRPLDNPRGDGIARREIDIVTHAMRIVFEVATNLGQLRPFLASQLALGAHLPKAGDHRVHFTLEHAKDPIVYKAQGLLLIATVEQMRGVPYPWGGMQQVENFNRIGFW